MFLLFLTLDLFLIMFHVFHLVDAEPDRREVLFVLARDFLHQTDQDGAAVHSVVRVVVHVLQTDEELRVGAERGCREKKGGFVRHAPGLSCR